MRWLKIRQLDNKLETYRPLLQSERPKEGWIKAIREALGMTLDQVARKIHIQKSTVSFHEKSEQKGTISLNTLEQFASILGCKFVYAFVPEKNLEDVLNQRIQSYAEHEIDSLSHSMLLEEQKTTHDHTEREKLLLINQIMKDKNISKIWEDFS